MYKVEDNPVYGHGPFLTSEPDIEATPYSKYVQEPRKGQRGSVHTYEDVVL